MRVGYSLQGLIFGMLLSLIFIAACKSRNDRENAEWRNIEQNLQTRLIMAEEGDTIRLESGYFWFTKTLSIENKSNLVIIGAGMDKTILSFQGQTEGAEGIKVVNSINIQFLDFTIEDAKGDNIKVSDTNGIFFRRVKSQWTGGASEKNGAYAFYPVLCTNVIIEECEAVGASDAGIYVGQSDTVIIRNNIAHQNVAGIESENSKMVDIYNNTVFDNTGGILVFDLPGLSQYGSQTRIYNNIVSSNNHQNFAPKGNIVGVVPPGTGIMLLATRDVEVFDNFIENNRTTGTAIISYELVIAMGEEDEDNQSEISVSQHNNNYSLDSLYNPYPENIYIHNNTFSNKHWFPTLKSDFGKLLLWKFPFKTPDILFDGFIDKSPQSQGLRLCIEEEEVGFANINAPEDLKNIQTDISPFECSGESYKSIEILMPTFQKEVLDPQLL